MTGLNNQKLAPTRFLSHIGKKLLAIKAISLIKNAYKCELLKIDKIKLLSTRTIFYSAERWILVPVGDSDMMVKIQFLV